MYGLSTARFSACHSPQHNARMSDSQNKPGPLAQLEEQLTLNQQVTGSIPVRLTIFEANSTHFFSSPFSLVSILSSLLNKIPDFSLNFA